MKDVVNLKDSKQAIRQQAGEWLVKIDSGDLSAEEQRTLNAWTKKSRLHFETLTQMAESIDSLKETANRQAGSVEQHAPVAPGNLWHNWVVKVAAIFAFVVIVPLVYYMNTMVEFKSTNGEYVTQVGGQKTLTLVDGSVVTLNTDSRLIVEYQDGKRLLRLLNGEANFDVAPDENHPFIVRAGKGDVQALGTSFAVRLKGEEVDVLVSHGTVRVRADESVREQPLQPDSTPKPQAPANRAETQPVSSVVVGAGKRVVFDESIVASVSEEDEESLNRHLYWRKGYLAFKDQPLSQVLEEVSRYTTYNIILSDASLGEIRVGGYYPIDNIETVFSSLEINLGLQVEKQGEGTFFIKKNS
ncbi:MAG: FecR domain-containing protein [Alteromonadaceae bacterium]|nr:FecR domain-containing protein [Alteromonadaceae bacterium]